ncbi:hypothetical protein FQN54_005652 [Arachnomyces sp. PD_36]|nr:hypothetical protein FQN54_005652 [Arachnomyces sp. PD_36]
MSKNALCEVCAQIDFKKHIYGDNGIKYHICMVQLGQLKDIRERSVRTRCVVCLGLLRNLSQDPREPNPDDARCYFRTGSVCQCAHSFSVERDGFTTCRHPRHVVFQVEATRTCQNLTFQVGLPNSDSIPSHGAGAGLVPESDPRCLSGRKFLSVADPHLFRTWLNLCEHHHGEKCKAPIWPKPPPQPKLLLVIDVSRRCVVPAPPECQFVALSYVWGASNTKKLTGKNEQELINNDGALKENDTPATIWDAIQVTEALGKKYCWVDALCIYQDDVARQQDQISQMGAIYSRAVVTLVAAAGDAATGLCGVRPNSRTVNQDAIPLEDFTLIRIADQDVNESSLSTRSQSASGWHKRAWTYQEGLFSRRMLIFREKQVYWRCQSATWLEEMVLETVENEKDPMTLTNIRSTLNNGIKVPKKLNEIDTPYSCRNRPTPMDDDEKLYYLYNLLLAGYISRQLSFRSDTLNAFAGVTRALTLLNNEEFIWGLPKSTFNLALSWTLNPPAGWSRSDTHQQDVLLPDGSLQRLPFPSWSWASCGCGILTGNSVDYFGSQRKPGLIIFYSCLINGEITRITPTLSEEESNAILSANRNTTEKWLGRPRYLKQNTALQTQNMVHSGTLKFWTSIATIYMFRERQRARGPPRMAFLSSGAQPLAVTANLESQTHTSLNGPRIPERLRRSIPNPLKNYVGNPLEGDLDVIILNIVVVDKAILQGTGTLSGRSGSGHLLYGLAVEWRSGIAYREGWIHIPEEDWILVEDREWKLVTLR